MILIHRNKWTAILALLCSTSAIFFGAATTAPADSKSDQNCFQVDGHADKIVCACDEQTCGRLQFDWPQESGQARLVSSTRAGARFEVSEIRAANATGKEQNSMAMIRVNLKAKKQFILGWGGAFTDAATLNIKSLSAKMTDELLQNYFSPDGLNYNMGRVPIAGSDFSTRPYSYDDSELQDFNLTEWSLAREDLDLKIPVIKRAIELTGGQLKLFASPWSPPKWMKTNRNFKRGFLIDQDQVYESYANYLGKFFDAYSAVGVNFWGATVQNEPIAAYLPVYYFNSLQLSNKQTIKFIAKYLGPALEERGLTKENFKLMVGDDSLGFINMQVPSVMADPGVQKYVSGLAFHWYTSGMVAPYDSLTRVVDQIKDHIEFVLMSEACEGSMPGSKHVDLGSWERAESYAHDIFEDLKRQTSGWIDWNLALDERGGPNWANNFVDSPIIVNKSGNKFYKQPMYYALAHFSRFFRPQSQYVDSKLEGGGRWTRQQLMFGSVQSGSYVVVNVMNKANKRKQIMVQIEHDDGNKKFGPIQVEPRSINSIVIKM